MRARGTIPFNSYITQPYYALGPLFYTKWDTEVETISERKVAGYKVDNILFDLDKSESYCGPGKKNSLRSASSWWRIRALTPCCSAYTDETGKPEYNMELSRDRAEAAADYLYKNFNLSFRPGHPHMVRRCQPRRQ